MRKITKKTAVILAGSSLLVAVGGGVAFAYWTSSGGGTGSATTATSNNSVAVAQTSVDTGLAPGVAPVALTGTITNNGTNSVYVNQLTITVSGVDSNHSTGCGAADYGLATGSGVLDNTAPHTIKLDIKQDIAPNGVVNFSGVNIGFADNPGADQSACEGATPALSYSTD
ncbi:MAG TPA: hypothetical protein VJ914_36205 [Pseudonocardiaceae bacterium]|nr:hypothetical protein [Pseudonocardiaceae bacterium]